MAMISCPNCGKQISDKATMCVHCGYSLVEAPKITCPECGAELSGGVNVCPSCGCPIEEPGSENKEQSPQQVELTKVNIKPSINKKVLGIALIALIAIVGIVFGAKTAREKKAIEEAAAISADYGVRLESLSNSMLREAANAETCGNLIHDVWYNSIYKESDMSTDKYTRNLNGYGDFYDDFNEALAYLFIDKSFSGKITVIKSNQEAIAYKMKEMKNPPEEWKDAYDDLKKLYEAYVDLTNIVVNPTGSLQTFTSNFNDADTRFSKAYNAIKLYF